MFEKHHATSSCHPGSKGQSQGQMMKKSGPKEHNHMPTIHKPYF